MKSKYYIGCIFLLGCFLSKAQQNLTFKVAEVKPAVRLLKTDSARKIFENKLGHKILFIPQEHANSSLVNAYNNVLIQTVQECYDQHRALVLSPDIIWLTICQGISIHVNENYDSLKNIIFKTDKPSKLLARNDSLGIASRHWPDLINSLSDSTKKYTKSDLYSFFISDFSTSGAIEKTVSQITLLESFKKAFEYVGMSGCGIPSITLKGTKNDWLKLYEKLNTLETFGMKDWEDNLKLVIKEFINVYDGINNNEFWKSIYKDASEYNAFYISGWIIKLFPYIKTLEFDGNQDDEKGSRAKELFQINKFMTGNKYCESQLSTDNFPSGVSKIEIEWKDFIHKKNKQVLVFGGFLAIKQYADKSLEPLISWAICDAKPKLTKYNLKHNERDKTEHQSAFWSPNFPNNLVSKAVYNIKRFTNHETSVAFLKKMLEDSLRNSTKYDNTELSKIKIEFKIYSNGTLEDIVINSKNKRLVSDINTLLIKLPDPWFPALANTTDALMLMMGDENEKPKKVRVNSKVKLLLFNQP